MMKFLTARLRGGRHFARDTAGVSAVEFALVAPVFLLMTAGLIDLGSMLFTRFQLNSALSAGANYALINGADLSATTAGSLAANTAAVLAGTTSSGTSVSVKINNGYTATMTGGTLSTSGATSEADKCYCPTKSGSVVAWGSAATCGSACANGSLAGKFVTFTASRPHTPMFSGYGFAEAGNIRVVSMAQTQ